MLAFYGDHLGTPLFGAYILFMEAGEEQFNSMPAMDWFSQLQTEVLTGGAFKVE